MDRNYPLEYWKDFAGPFPQMVFADKVRGLFAYGVKVKTQGYYGHFCWLIGPNEIASQWWWFQRQKLEHYRDCYLKFVHNPHWTEMQRLNLLVAINKDLDLSKWKTRYDVVGVIGELFDWKWLNRRGLYFCSERGSYLKLVDPLYTLVHPDPTELNEYTKGCGLYEVSGRYSPG
jgi:hypothetical protein